MLIITRKAKEGIVIDGEIKIVVLEIEGNRVKLGIKAPRKTRIFREELIEAVKRENQLAGNTSQIEIDFTIYKSSEK